ncbi:MAG: hypothetical protein NUV78_00590 [Candidatus Zambryskibacteria bacterium]|nr:hypothetical protein [Candidatus Zambryskibacteria bacterium]
MTREEEKQEAQEGINKADHEKAEHLEKLSEIAKKTADESKGEAEK